MVRPIPARYLGLLIFPPARYCRERLAPTIPWRCSQRERYNLSSAGHLLRTFYCRVALLSSDARAWFEVRDIADPDPSAVALLIERDPGTASGSVRSEEHTSE